MPFFHIAGMMLTMMSGLHKGSSMVMMPKFMPELFLSLIEQYKIAGTLLPPPLVLFVANHPMVDEYDMSSLKHAIYGAAPTASKVAVKAKQRLNLDHLQQGYGLTEVCITHITPVGVFKPESVGVPLPHIKCKVVDIETGTPVGPNCQGELHIQGPQVC